VLAGLLSLQLVCDPQGVPPISGVCGGRVTFLIHVIGGRLGTIYGSENIEKSFIKHVYTSHVWFSSSHMGTTPSQVHDVWAKKHSHNTTCYMPPSLVIRHASCCHECPTHVVDKQVEAWK